MENASTISIKEKYRQDMKREIKRLQRLRDLFRQNVNNPAVSEQHKLVEARKRIENVSYPWSVQCSYYLQIGYPLR